MPHPHGLARLSLALALLAAPPAAAVQYYTDAYALIAHLPDSWHICMGEGPEPNHGFWVLMDRGDCNRHYPVAEVAFPMVTFTVGYNVAYEYPTTPAMRANICGRAPAHWSPLRIAGARLMRCNLPAINGLARIAHFGLRWRKGDTTLASTEVAIFTQCPPARMPQCLAVAATIAARLRDWPQPR